MKIRKTKKALKRSTSVRIIMLKDTNPNRFFDTLLPVSYNPEIEVLEFCKTGITIFDNILNKSVLSFPYYMITSIE